MTYQHLFFDLDHTLWDFERNSSESLQDIYHSLSLNKYGVSSLENFVNTFLRINTQLWDDFDHGRLHHSYIREKRFLMVFEELGIPCPDNHLEIGELYLQTLPQKKHLLEGALDILEYATNKGYKMHIVTNGFTAIQAKKLSSSGIHHFFENVVTFEGANAKKPEPAIFSYALKMAQTAPENCLMIGDNWVADIQGASRSGLDTVYLNPARLTFESKPTFDIQKLEELKSII